MPNRTGATSSFSSGIDLFPLLTNGVGVGHLVFPTAYNKLADASYKMERHFQRRVRGPIAHRTISFVASASFGSSPGTSFVIDDTHTLHLLSSESASLVTRHGYEILSDDWISNTLSAAFVHVYGWGADGRPIACNGQIRRTYGSPPVSPQNTHFETNFLRYPSLSIIVQPEFSFSNNLRGVSAFLDLRNGVLPAGTYWVKVSLFLGASPKAGYDYDTGR
jgi:hypothetical protein